MADNTTFNAGSGGNTFADDDISGVKYSRIKLIHGADGVNDGDVSSTNGLPVSQQVVVDTPETFKDTSFVSGDSPVTLDINTALGRNATRFAVHCDGTGNIDVQLSTDGAVFGDTHTMKNGEVWTLDNISVDSIKITHTGTDSSYRVWAI